MALRDSDVSLSLWWMVNWSDELGAFDPPEPAGSVAGRATLSGFDPPTPTLEVT